MAQHARYFERLQCSKSHANVAALSTALIMTLLFLWILHTVSCIYQTEIPQPINVKFCTIDYVDMNTPFAGNGYDRLSRGGPLLGWSTTSTTLLTILYHILYCTYYTILTLYFTTFTTFYLISLVSLCRQVGSTKLCTCWLKRCRLPSGSAFWGSRWYEITNWGQNPKN